MSWERMARTSRVLAGAIEPGALPDGPGAYVLYREGVPVYVGKATSLRERISRNHLRRGPSMADSALRRNVAELLGIATAADIKARRYRPTPEDARRTTEWIASCEFSWLECATVHEAEALEERLKLDLSYPLLLTKR